LDAVASGTQDPVKYLEDYYNGENGLKAKVDTQEDKIDPQEARLLDLPLEGLEGIKVAVGRYGPYISKGEDDDKINASVPEKYNPSDLSVELIEDIIEREKEGDTPIGEDPETEEPIFLLTGRYGPYVQRGEVTEENKKPKRVSLLKGMEPSDVDIDLALKLLELPRPLGDHPEDGKVIKAGVGRYGPFVVHDGKFKSIPKSDSVLEIELDRAVELLAQKSKSKRGSNTIKELGNHPETDKPIKVMTGRYGPYIKHGKKNISLPDGETPEDFTMDKAVALIKEKGK